MDNVIKSFNIDGVKHSLNLSQIGAYVGNEGQETELKAYIDSHSGGGGGDYKVIENREFPESAKEGAMIYFPAGTESLETTSYKYTRNDGDPHSQWEGLFKLIINGWREITVYNNYAGFIIGWDGEQARIVKNPGEIYYEDCGEFFVHIDMDEFAYAYCEIQTRNDFCSDVQVEQLEHFADYGAFSQSQSTYEKPVAAQTFRMQDGMWYEIDVIKDAPEDGKQYVRMGRSWQPLEGGSDVRNYYFDNNEVNQDAFNTFTQYYYEGGIEYANDKVRFFLRNDWNNQVCQPLYVNFKDGTIYMAFIHRNDYSEDNMYIWCYWLNEEGQFTCYTQKKIAFETT